MLQCPDGPFAPSAPIPPSPALAVNPSNSQTRGNQSRQGGHVWGGSLRSCFCPLDLYLCFPRPQTGPAFLSHILPAGIGIGVNPGRELLLGPPGRRARGGRPREPTRGQRVAAVRLMNDRFLRIRRGERQRQLRKVRRHPRSCR